MKYLKYFLAGCIFGIILIKSEVVSWFRVQEMFRFQSFHMYGIILSAILTAITGTFLLKKAVKKNLEGNIIVTESKPLRVKANLIGGTIFGLGWALTGACPGPMFAMSAACSGIVFVMLLSAVAGTFVYGCIKKYLPQ